MKMRRSIRIVLVLATIWPAAVSARSVPKLTDLLLYYNVRVGPAAPGHLPRGFVCKTAPSGRCHCDAYMYLPGVGIGGLDGPSKQCGLRGYLIDRPMDVDGRLPIAAREFTLAHKQIASRYGKPTYSGRARNGWSNDVYCTDLDGRLLEKSELKPVAEFYEFAFAYSGDQLQELDVAWTNQCDANDLAMAPIP
jgi:hypothetical protein